MKLLQRLYFKFRFGINFRRKEVKTMLTTILKFEGSDGTAFVGAIESKDVKDFQQMQKHIIHALLKLGDDGVSGITPKATDAKVKPQLTSTISMETVGSGELSGFYAKSTGTYKFNHPQNYQAEVDFCTDLLQDVKHKFGKKE
jgi:hypothetical protein